MEQTSPKPLWKEFGEKMKQIINLEKHKSLQLRDTVIKALTIKIEVYSLQVSIKFFLSS